MGWAREDLRSILNTLTYLGALRYTNEYTSAERAPEAESGTHSRSHFKKYLLKLEVISKFGQRTRE